MEYSKFFKTWISDVSPYIPGKMSENFIKLASNENDYGPSKKVINVIKDKAKDVFRYPYKDESVKEKISECCNSSTGKNLISKENIILGNGSDEIIELLIKTFRSPYIGFYPSFAEYNRVAKIFNEIYYEIPLNDDFCLDCGKFINNKKFEKAKVVFLCSPNNPTGGIIERRDIEKILKFNKIVVVDEAYYEFSNLTCIDLIDNYENLIVLRTMAKAFGIAGLRMGYGIANKEIIKFLHKVKPPFNVNYLAQEAALAALDDNDFMKQNVEKIINSREILSKILSKKFKIFNSRTNFIFADVSPYTAKEFFEAIYEKKIIVRPFGKLKGFKGEYVRITVGTEDENKILIEVIENTF
ncbi:Histidinol-phosphate aminotransferase [groundwater metagenome]|uniref:Histidinol-phosphate aminotransferase n=1 Tax=groundwater metagenome TaxID=717931 RepID=A0A098EE05_9ZZZZ